ncbi:uncharacterized protein LOC120158683 [Hibiscus syriacus]|uniref:uncharacterized protein LOC120158683 n=1 Tax=Hibiscus syriacus TaxID=106335 RepID=UPI0019243BDA|nr:uncharacterized protein LOC120158683 [Hibiscus syriacus]
MLFIQTTNLAVWDAIVDSSSTPSRNRKDWTSEDKKLAQLNDKAIHILFCTLGPNKYSRVSSCSNAKDIWDKLEVTHEGTSQVKKPKIGLFTLNYKNLKMKPDEDMKIMYDRFNSIRNKLKTFGNVYPNEKVVRKMLASLPISWEGKATSIEEAKDLEL